MVTWSSVSVSVPPVTSSSPPLSMVTLVESSMVLLLPLAISWPLLLISMLPPEIVSIPVMFSVPLTSSLAAVDVVAAAAAAMVSVPLLSTVTVPPTILLVSSSVSRPSAVDGNGVAGGDR